MSEAGTELVYSYDTKGERTGITALLSDLNAAGYPLPRSANHAIVAGGYFRRPGRTQIMNWRAIWAIYSFEMARTGRTLLQSIVSPVISTCLYFVVFGAAIGSRIQEIEGVPYGSFIVPGLIMMMLLTQSVANASFGIYFPRFIGTIYEILSAPVSFLEIVIGYVGAAATKSIILGRYHSGDGGLFRAVANRAPVLDGGLPRADRRDLQPASASSSASGPTASRSCRWCRFSSSRR